MLCVLFCFFQFQEQLQGYCHLYDLSRSERSKVHELAVTMATDGQPLESIGKLLHVAVGPLDLSVKTVLHAAVERVVTALRYCWLTLFIFHYIMYVVKTICNIQQYMQLLGQQVRH